VAGRAVDGSVECLNAAELDIFVGPDYLITVPNTPVPPVEYLFERCRSSEEARDQLFASGSGYLLYKIVDDSFDYCFPMLRTSSTAWRTTSSRGGPTRWCATISNARRRATRCSP